MKKIMFILSLMVCTMAAQAQYTKSLKLTKSDGSSVLINLSRSLVITFDNGQMKAADGDQQLSFALDGLKMEYSPEQAATAIESVPQQADKPVVENGTITFRNLAAGQQVRIYAADGRLLQTIATQDGNARVSLESLPKGISIVKAGSYSLKYQRR